MPVDLTPFSLTPWPLGENSYHRGDPTHQDYQLSEERPAQLLYARDVLLDNAGLPSRRPGLTQRIMALTGGKTLHSGLGLLLFQDAGTIYRINTTTWTTSAVVTGLNASARVTFLNHADRLLYTNGLVKGQIYSDGTSGHWGLDVPPVATVVTVPGSLPAGQYLVSATLVDAKGVEHAANKPYELTVAANQSIFATLGSVDSNAVYVKWYCSRTDGPSVHWTKTVAVGTLPTIITSVTESTERLRTLAMSPPVPASVLFSYRSMVMLGVENAVFPSYGAHHHLFELDRTGEYFPDDVVAGAGLQNGFWTVTAKGAHWTTGERPENWDTYEVDKRAYAGGSIVVSGTLFPGLQVASKIALFVSQDGVMYGTDEGTILPMTDRRQSLDVEGKFATFGFYRKATGTRARYLTFTLE